ncbi:MAG: NAD(P)/FAD-dependent oxidoreductase [Caldilineaceae bacterium]
MTDFTVGIIGGGPAGAATASYLAKAGLDCVVFERELFPRPHVGETFVPSSNRVFAELGFTQKMEDAGFLHKGGAVWTSKASTNLFGHDWDELGDEYDVDIAFREREMPGVNNVYTYHVDRAKFDLMLLQHAQELGATVYSGVQVTSVDLGDTPRINFRMGRKTTSVDVKMVVDASGRHTLLGQQLKLKVKDPLFDQFALHTWFKDYDRGSTHTDEYLVVYFLPFPNTWVWQIPITDEITSIGIVTQKTNFPKANQSREAWFWDCLATLSEFRAKLQQAERIRPFTAEGDYSYAMTAVAGDNFALVGDAARFVDPIFSSGVSVALNSARLVTPHILKAAQTNDFSAATFAEYAHTIRVGTRNWYKFINLYYRLNILFTQFIRDPRYRLDVLKLLQGDVYDEEEPPVLGAMQRFVESVERDEKHVFHRALGQLSAKELRSALV